jgi:glycosyltransferase involved in cell wall biosynthesis
VKIAFVVLDNILSSNGTTVRVKSVVKLLSKTNDVTIVNCSHSDTHLLPGSQDINIINVHGIGHRLLVSESLPLPLKVLKFIPLLLWNIKICSILIRYNYDIVYCVDDFFGFPGIFLVSKIKTFKIIMEAHGIYSEENAEVGAGCIRQFIDTYLEKFAVRHTNFTIALSKNIFEFYKLYTTNIDIIPVFLELAAPYVKNKSGNNKLVGIIGPFGINKRQNYYLDFLYNNIDCFDKLISFLLIGKCERRVVHERINYSGYIDSFEEYFTTLSGLDAVLIPEGIATSGPLNKIIEPMSLSIPVFTTMKAITGLYSIKNGKDLLAFEEDCLIRKINELIFDNDLMATIGNNGRHAIEQYYSKQVNEKKLNKIITFLTGDNSPVP